MAVCWAVLWDGYWAGDLVVRSVAWKAAKLDENLVDHSAFLTVDYWDSLWAVQKAGPMAASMATRSVPQRAVRRVWRLAADSDVHWEH